jgi:UrcA family protein
MISRLATALFLPSLAIAALVASQPATAQSVETRSIAVRTADLDLRTPAGAAELEHRIAHAAANACGTISMSSLEERDRTDACRAKAKADAMAEANTLVAAAKSSSLYAMNDKGWAAMR